MDKMEERMSKLDKIARQARRAVRHAAQEGRHYVWVGQTIPGKTRVAGGKHLPPGMRSNIHAVYCPLGQKLSDLSERELDRWAIKVLWTALDCGLLPEDITEADFRAAYLQR